MSAPLVALLALVIGIQLVPLKSSRDRFGRLEINWNVITECVLQSAPPGDDWQRHEFLNLSFLLPSDFKTTQPPIVFDHGGQMWADGDRTVSIIAGFWGPTSFESWPGTACRTSADGHPVLLMEAVGTDQVTVQAWYPDHPLLVARAKRQRDLTLLRTILLSGVSKGR